MSLLFSKGTNFDQSTVQLSGVVGLRINLLNRKVSKSLRLLFTASFFNLQQNIQCDPLMTELVRSSFSSQSLRQVSKVPEWQIRDFTEFILKAGLFQKPRKFGVPPGGEKRQLSQFLSAAAKPVSAQWNLTVLTACRILSFAYYHFSHLVPNKNSSRAGVSAQWWSTYLACMRPWVPSTAKQPGVLVICLTQTGLLFFTSFI